MLTRARNPAVVLLRPYAITHPPAPRRCTASSSAARRQEDRYPPERDWTEAPGVGPCRLGDQAKHAGPTPSSWYYDEGRVQVGVARWLSARLARRLTGHGLGSFPDSFTPLHYGSILACTPRVRRCDKLLGRRLGSERAELILISSRAGRLSHRPYRSAVGRPRDRTCDGRYLPTSACSTLAAAVRSRAVATKRLPGGF